MSTRIAPATPKQPRAHATRLKLLGAAVEELVEHGYSGLTTVSVARRAGVSRGAQQNYFPHKATLVSEAIEHLVERQIAELNDGLSDLASGHDRLVVALDRLFSQYSGPLFAAVVELSLAARDEPDLRPVIRKGERRISDAIHGTASVIFGSDVASVESFSERWGSVLATVRGTALLRLIGYPPNAVERQWVAARRDALTLLQDWI